MGPYAKRSPSRRMVTTNNIANSFESKWKGPPTTADHRGFQRRRRGTGRAHLLIPNRGLDRYTRSGGREGENPPVRFPLIKLTQTPYSEVSSPDFGLRLTTSRIFQDRSTVPLVLPGRA